MLRPRCVPLRETLCERRQALPCSSGSSEIWFASKIFTGEGVVIKRVSEDKVEAFERERAVLKVRGF